MSQRILELADQAAEDMSGALNIPDEFCKKFAELIVRECAELMEKQHSWITNVAASNLIRKHFGVEE
jgi:hypothetical protein